MSLSSPPPNLFVQTCPLKSPAKFKYQVFIPPLKSSHSFSPETFIFPGPARRENFIHSLSINYKPFAREEYNATDRQNCFLAFRRKHEPVNWVTESQTGWISPRWADDRNRRWTERLEFMLSRTQLLFITLSELNLHKVFHTVFLRWQGGDTWLTSRYWL